MNRLLKVFLALSATVTLTAVLLAADDQPAPDRGGATAGERGPGERGRGERGDALRGIFAAGLDLTAEQRQKLDDLRKKSEAEARAVLTPEQQTKLDEFRSRRFDYEDEGERDAAAAGNPEKWAERAMAFDADKNGSLSKEELTTMAKAMAERRGERVERRGDRAERRGERVEGRGERLEGRGERLEQRGERTGGDQ